MVVLFDRKTVSRIEKNCRDMQQFMYAAHIEHTNNIHCLWNSNYNILFALVETHKFRTDFDQMLINLAIIRIYPDSIGKASSGFLCGENIRVGRYLHVKSDILNLGSKLNYENSRIGSKNLSKMNKCSKFFYP